MNNWCRKTKARLLGYFWTPCPVCGEMFAGYEIKGLQGYVTVKNGDRKACCPKCNFIAGIIETINDRPFVLTLPQHANHLIINKRRKNNEPATIRNHSKAP